MDFVLETSGWRGGKQGGIEGKGDGDGATVAEVEGEGGFGKPNGFDEGRGFAGKV